MDIKELQARRAKLERDISTTTQDLINEFERETAVQVTSTRTDIHRTEAMGEPVRFIIGGTEVDLDI